MTAPAGGFGIALDCALGALMPANVEGPVGREEVERRIGQVLMDPARHDPLVAWLLVLLPEARDNDAGHVAHVTVCIEPIPDMASNSSTLSIYFIA